MTTNAVEALSRLRGIGIETTHVAIAHGSDSITLELEVFDELVRRAAILRDLMLTDDEKWHAHDEPTVVWPARTVS